MQSLYILGVFPPFLWQCTSYTFVYTPVLEDKHTFTLTIRFVKGCVLYIKFWILKPRKYWLKSSTYYFIKHARSLHGFGCGCGYLQMTHHRWPGSPGMQGWTMQGAAGGPSFPAQGNLPQAPTHTLQMQFQSTCLLPS